VSGRSGNKTFGLTLFLTGNTGLLTLSAILFTLSFPSFINTNGFPLLSWFSLFPAFIVTYRMSWKSAPFYGLYLGLLSYALFNYWLASFHPLTIFIVPFLYAAYYLLLFPFLKLSNTLFPRYSFAVNTVIWVGYEYLRTKGFLGYSYGIMGYTQYLFPHLVRLSSITGVWGVSFLVIFPSAFISYALKDLFISTESVNLKDLPGQSLTALRNAFSAGKKPVSIYFILFALAIFWGFASKTEIKDLDTWKVSLIQQNIDPWQGGFKTYKESLYRLKKLSKIAKKENPDIIIWSETSFVPAIEWHSKYRTDPDTYELVKELKEFLADETIPYLIGNDEGRLITDENNNSRRVDYNAAIYYENGEVIDIYRKMHLVPFTEHFPYKKQLPWLHELLLNSDTHFWEKGKEYTVFESGDVKFSTPICFEDTFGYISREFIRRGADVIVNITNDSWSGSVVAEVQHMMHAVFRAAENSRSVVRSTNGGITCIIDPDGRIINRIAPFEESWLTGEVPLKKGNWTIYTRYGDWAGVAAVVVSLLLLAARAVFLLRKRIKEKTD
jgi:apolipoprotein N-acyltransferase